MKRFLEELADLMDKHSVILCLESDNGSAELSFDDDCSSFNFIAHVSYGNKDIYSEDIRKLTK